ncbi:metal-sulfur cluster assembly factor [Actinocorallia sp. API 0066]|uniref:metal-sulfur cluster assembly factor n=1 Tax=Actinocorallia sp. API 0066 TaxID=2896846 RepID=UPI001E41BBB8|nr:metal-sulfur cluster assembly factor [Actinocorallia sp. API 0066]MCD0453730.1 metal-sulfur cluster assembly factor [Actinocorallia sp. API 0066]
MTENAELSPSEESVLDALTGGSEEEEQILDALRDVVDPELGINVVDLGLIYGLNVDETEGHKLLTVDMTLTSAACPLTDVIEDQAQSATADLVDELKINWVWLPPWGPDKITEDGREQLRALGFNV